MVLGKNNMSNTGKWGQHIENRHHKLLKAQNIRVKTTASLRLNSDSMDTIDRRHAQYETILIMSKETRRSVFIFYSMQPTCAAKEKSCKWAIRLIGNLQNRKFPKWMNS